MHSEATVALNHLPAARQAELLERCCGSGRWVQSMVQRIPFADWQALRSEADKIWLGLDREDWLEAFAQHPKIGDIDSLRARFATTKSWSEGEQSGVDGASEEVLTGLAAGNRHYEQRFGYIFIVCATGKSAAAMLELLQERLGNSPDDELPIAAEQQRQIMQLRLDKLREELVHP